MSLRGHFPIPLDEVQFWRRRGIDIYCFFWANCLFYVPLDCMKSAVVNEGVGNPMGSQELGLREKTNFLD
jgi:hypothetical protein